MAEKRKNMRNPSARRGLSYFLMILAAAAILIWMISGGGGKTPSKELSSVVESASKDKGSPGDGGVSVPYKGVQAPQEVDDSEDGERKKRELKKVIKIGQTQVVGSESLDFSTEQQRPGLMWLPIGLHEVSSGDPWVAMCLIDYGHYQENPSATPMYTFLNNYSKCGAKRSEGGKGGVGMGSVELVRMSSLMRSMKETNLSPIPPKGFVYHETRCGSTLVANMLASLPPSRVFSESKPPTQTIRECYAEGCSRDMMISIFRNVVALMGRRREGEQHEHLYYKFQNSKFIPEISEAFPEVPWIFVFRDPVEVMVSNLKSFTGAPCVRIPRQEKMRKAGGGGQGWGKKMALPNFGPRGKADVPGGNLSGRARLPPGRRWLREGGDDGAVSPGIDGTVRYAVQAAVATEEELSSFATVSWNGFGGSGVWDEHSNYNSTTGFQEGSEMALLSKRWGGGRGNEGRRLIEKRLAKQLKLTMNMTMECADWLKSLCVSAVEGGRDFPRKALFVDYANLPDAVPEYVFPKHFDMAREVEKTVPDWEERMWKAAGSYSKGGGKTGRVFAGDIEAKHKQASPLIVEASELEGGLYEIYHTLDGMQTWRRPNTTDGGE